MTLGVLRYFANLLGNKPMPTLSAGQTAPDFQLVTSTGERLSLTAALAGGPILLAFFKVSCPTCQFTFPFLERLQRQLPSPDAHVWGVVQDKAQDAVRFAATFGITFPILIDESPYAVSRTYGLTHVPSLFLVKPDGQIAIASEGFCKADLLAIQNSLVPSLSAPPPALFLPTERIPEYKPG